jgi:hypothetical protein
MRAAMGHWRRTWRRSAGPAWPSDALITQSMRHELAAIADHRQWESRERRTVASVADYPAVRSKTGDRAA